MVLENNGGIVNESAQAGLLIDHIAIAVTDLDEAVDWYQTLGFEELERRVTKGRATSMRSAVMISGSSVVILVQGIDKDCQVQRFVDKYGPGVQHVAFAVQDLDRVVARLQLRGAGPEFEIIEGDGIRQVFLKRDPGSGVRVELIERRGGTFSDDTVERLYRAFEDAGAY